METLSQHFESSGRTDSAPAWLEQARGGLRCQTVGAGAMPVVLIHELGGSLDSWSALAAALMQSLPGTLRLLRYDQRGQGRSARVRAPYALADQTGDLHALLESIDTFEAKAATGPNWLIGAAAGAAVAVNYAVRHPQHVAGIVLCSPALDVSGARRGYLRERGELAVREGMRAVVDGTMDNSWPAAIRTDAAAFDTYRARFVTQDARGYALASEALSTTNVEAELRALRCPCLFLAGEHDLQRPPPHVAAQAARVAHARFETVAQAGHLMAVQQPEAVARRIAAFIAGASS